MCGTEWNRTRSASNKLLMNFVTDRNRQRRGFIANYTMGENFLISILFLITNKNLLI